MSGVWSSLSAWGTQMSTASIPAISESPSSREASAPVRLNVVGLDAMDVGLSCIQLTTLVVSISKPVTESALR